MKLSLKARFLQHKEIILYSFALGILFFVLKYAEYHWLILQHSYQLYIGFIALAFTGLGVWLALKVSNPKKEIVIVEKQILVSANQDFIRDEKMTEDLGISKRELEVLEKMAQGLSNQEIAEQLFLSVNTVKTHTSNILQKLDVKRRTQAIEKARRLSLIR